MQQNSIYKIILIIISIALIIVLVHKSNNQIQQQSDSEKVTIKVSNKQKSNPEEITPKVGIKQKLESERLTTKAWIKESDEKKKLFSEIFNSSSEQNLIDPQTILQTASFMIQETDEFDPKLINFVRSLIHKPSGKQLNLDNKNKKDFSQIGQSHYMDSLLGKITNGFFVEAGGYTGEGFSNTLFFELERQWTGILIEPVPSLHSIIVSKNRNIYSINACIAKKHPIVSKFIRASDSALSGRLSEMSQGHSNRVGRQFDIIYVPCFSLNTILKAIDVNKVDYFSLDVEGGEWDVLSSLDLKNIDFRSFSIEHNGETQRRDQMRDYLINNNYKVPKMDGQDLYSIKNNL
ncbi:unnamed protein product [Brachionus calyciflorus]|uniref:Methyltransferase FkbM domain-containing protein n=1 Tax=Brachionus calyciflorus TaxID=104777 RepID=A0A813PZT2_9BILA|nr:unnamed protein product [Brachionus calyciflorus]